MATRFFVTGARKDNGAEQTLRIEADNATQAEEIAIVRGMFVSNVRFAGPSKPIIAITIFGCIAFGAGLTWWLMHSATVSPIKPLALSPAIAPNEPAITLGALQAFGERLNMLLKSYDDRIFVDTDTLKNTNKTKLLRVDLKNTDSLVHPIVGEIVVYESIAAEDKSIRLFTIGTYTYTITVALDKAGWNCIKAMRRTDSVFPFSTTEPVGVELDATNIIRTVMKGEPAGKNY